MANSSNSRDTLRTGGGFRISVGPIVEIPEPQFVPEFSETLDLPRVTGRPALFAIARDSRTVFAYWEIDWPSVFQINPPADRQVHLRVLTKDGSEEKTVRAEPMAGSCYVTVAQPRATYRVEIGYFQPDAVWNAVAGSDQVTMPAERVSENTDVDLATVPFHLSFQRLIDLFRATNREPLAELISQLQSRAANGETRSSLSPEELELLRAMNLSIEDLELAREAFMTRGNEAELRKKAEAILGFGATSPAGGFGGSSWG